MIEFYWREHFDQSFQRFRKTFELNRIKDIKTRKHAANVMIYTLNNLLAQGWNPQSEEFSNMKQLTGKDLPKHGYLKEELQKAHRHILLKTDKDRTHQTYESHLRLFLDYLAKKGLTKATLNAFNRMAAIDYQSSLIKMKLSPKTINSKTNYASGLFKWLTKAGLIEENPFLAIDHLKEPESKRNEIFTKEELQQIKAHCLEYCPQLWQFSLFIYFCFMRPASIMWIRRKDIDLETGWIFIDGKHHKNGKDA